MFGDVIEKKIPLRYPPKIVLPVVVEADHKRGDEMEFPPQIREGTESSDSLDHTTNVEERGDFCEHRYAIQIETKSDMPEQLGDIEEISRAAANVENALPAGQIEFDVANTANIDGDPPVEIEIFPPIVGGLADRVTLANLPESYRLDRFNNTLCLQRKSVRSKRS